MKVRELHPRGAVTAAPSETLRAAARRLAEDEIGALIIWGTLGPLGIFSERDLALAIADGVDVDEVQIKEYMTTGPISIDESEPIETGVAKMNDHGVRHLVVTETDDVVGVISMRDIVRVFDTLAPSG